MKHDVLVLVGRWLVSRNYAPKALPTFKNLEEAKIEVSKLQQTNHDLCVQLAALRREHSKLKIALTVSEVKRQFHL